jgi:hypothetical protein
VKQGGANEMSSSAAGGLSSAGSALCANLPFVNQRLFA